MTEVNYIWDEGIIKKCNSLGNTAEPRRLDTKCRRSGWESQGLYNMQTPSADWVAEILLILGVVALLTVSVRVS